MTVFTTKKFTVPGLLPDDALQEQLKQFSDSKKTEQRAAPPPSSAVSFADRIIDGFLEPHRIAKDATQAGRAVGAMVAPAASAPQAPVSARAAQDKAIDANSSTLADVVGPILMSPAAMVFSPTTAALGIAADMSTYSAEESAAAQIEMVEDAKAREAAMKNKAEVRAKLRGLPDSAAEEMGLPVAPGGRDLETMGQSLMNDAAVQQSAREETELKQAVAPTMPWWLNAAQTAARSSAQVGTGALRGIAVWLEQPGEFLNLRDPGERSVGRTWVDTVDAAITKMLPGDKAQSKDFLTDLSAGVGSFAGFLIAGYAGAAAGIPAGVAPGALGALSQGGQMYNEAEEFDATSTQKFLTLILGSALGMAEAVPIDRMFMRADAATGGLVRRMLRNSIAGAIEELIQETSQAIGEDVTAKYLAGFDPDREIDPREWARRGLIGAITGAAGGAATAGTGGPVSLAPPDIREAYIQAAIEDAQLSFDSIEGARDPDTDGPLAEQTQPDITGVDGPLAEQTQPDITGVDAMTSQPAQPVEATTFRGGSMPALREDGKLELVHWSDRARATLDPAQRGTGPLRGMERARLFGADAVDRTYYGVQATATRPARQPITQYLREREKQEPTPKSATPREKQSIRQQREAEYYAANETGGYVREGALGDARHTVAVDPNDIYNWFEDPLKIKEAGLDRTLKDSEQITQYERLIKDAGFKGYYVNRGPLGQTAALFDPAVPESVIDERTGEPMLPQEIEDDFLARTGDTPEETAKRREKALINLAEKVPGISGAMKYMTESEKARLSAQGARKIVSLFENLPDAEEMAAVAIAGKAKRGWYARSARALVDTFGLTDAPRFAALLAALSPQTPVESNAVNALNTWSNWIKAGRPTDPKKITAILGRSVMGDKGSGSVLPAWLNNSILALSSPDASMIDLSGPKVSSFMKNLQGVTNEVTNDTWIANFANISQNVFKGSWKPALGRNETSPGYIAMSALTRRAAEAATEMTGNTWTPAEIQETVWSWTKALYEMREKPGENRTADEIVAAGGLTDEQIAGVPDFASLFMGGVYRNILEKGGYGDQIEAIAAAAGGGQPDEGDGQGGSGEAGQGAGAAEGSLDARVLAAAKRLEALYRERTDFGETDEQALEASSLSHLSEEDLEDFLGMRVGDRLAPLPGSPRSSPGPIESVVIAAETYANSIGLPLRRQKNYVKADPDRGARIAQAYEDMKHDPSDPAVAAAYAALIEETLAQYQAVKASGLQVEFIEPGAADPYPEGPKQVLADLQKGHLWTFPTDSGFGTLNEISDNPLLAPTDEFVGERRLLANDVFRIVHDFFGHGLEGAGFGASGEENAWQSHMRLFTPAAIPAMTSETRGQNSWVNFGPHGEANRANQRETVYADQKSGVMPAWTWQEGVEDDLDAATARSPEEAFKAWFGDSKVVDESGVPLVVYHGTVREFSAFDETKIGDRDQGFFGRGFYFTSDKTVASDYSDTWGEEDMGDNGEAPPPRVIEAYLSLQDPYFIDLTDEAWPATRAALIDRGVASAKRTDDSVYSARTYNFIGREPNEFRRTVEGEGHDGIIVTKTDGSAEYIAFEPTQIKSVDNLGGYDPTNPDIYAARAPGTAANRAAYTGEQTRADAGTPEQPGQEPSDASLARISRNFVKLLGLTARHGRFTLKGSDVMGQYKRSAATVRLRTWNDLSTLVHEGGHAFHDAASGTLREFIRRNNTALKTVADKLYGGDTLTLNNDTHVREGFAEFFRVYTLNRAYAEREFPAVAAEFKALLDTEAPQIAIGLDAIGTQFMAYLQAPSTEVLSNQIVSGYQATGVGAAIKELRDAGFRSWMQEKARHSLEYTVNRYAPLNTLVNDLLNAGEKNTAGVIDLKRAEDPRILARLAPHSGSRAMIQLTDGVMGYRKLTSFTRGLREAIMISQGFDDKTTPSAFDEARLKDFSTFLVAMRALDEYRRFKEGKIARPPISLGLGDVQQVVVDMTAKYKDAFTEAAAIVHEYGMGLWQKQYDAGLMSKETYMAGLDRRFYVPLQRDMSDKKATLGESAVTGGRSLVKMFKGSDRDIVDPLAILMHKTFALEAAIAKNDIAVTLAKLADRAGRVGALVERVPAQQLMGTSFSVEEVARQLTKDDTLSEVDAQDLMTILEASMKEENVISLFRSEQASAKGENIHFFWEQGRVAAIQLRDGDVGADIINMFNGLGRENMSVGMELIAGTSTVFRTAITSWPDFLIVNFIRDQLSSWILTDVGFKPFVTGIKGVGDELRQREWAKQANAAQMIMGGMNVAALHEARLNRDVNSLRAKGYLPRVFSEPGIMGAIRGFGRVVELTETGTRLGLFRKGFERAKRDGLDDWEAGIEAAYTATDIIDFSLNGSKMLMYRRTIPFLNAQLQGLYKMMRTLGGDEVRQRKGLMFVLGAFFKSTKGLPLSRVEKDAINTGRKAWIKMLSIGMFSALLHFLFEDDEDYQEAGEYMRTTGWVIPLGNGRIAYIPKPFELAMVANAIERGLEHASGDAEAKNRFVRGAYMTLTPPTSPPALQVLIEHAANKDFFTGNEIIPDYMQALAPELQYNSYTSNLAKRLGETMGWSPMIVDHYLSGLGASAYRDIQWMSNAIDPNRPTTDATDRPIVRRFIRDIRRGSATSQDFWAQASKLTGRLQTAANSYKAYMEGGNEPAANQYLGSLGEDERAFALLDVHFKAEYKRLNPFYRGRQINTVVSAMRREIVSDLGLEDTTPDFGGAITLTSQQKADVDELLSELARREMRNTLVASDVPGWENKKMLDTEMTFALLDEVMPTAAEELRRRLRKAKVYDAELVFSSWPDVKSRLISDRDQAYLDDLVAMAKATMQ